MLFLLVAYHVLQGALLKRRTKIETEKEKKRKNGKYNIPVFFFIKRVKIGQKRFILYYLSYLTNGYYCMVVCLVRTSINHGNCIQFLCLSSKLKKKKCVDIKKQLDGIPRKRRNKHFTH